MSLFKYLVIVVALSVSLCSCQKGLDYYLIGTIGNNNGGGDTTDGGIINLPTSTTWTLNGIKYDEGFLGTPYSGQLFVASDVTLTNSIAIHFESKPTKNGTFVVVDRFLTPLTALNCSIDMTVTTANSSVNNYSIGQPGDIITVYVASDGKLIATFKDVSMKNNETGEIALGSGTMVEN